MSEALPEWFRQSASWQLRAVEDGASQARQAYNEMLELKCPVVERVSDEEVEALRHLVWEGTELLNNAGLNYRRPWPSGAIGSDSCTILGIVFYSALAALAESAEGMVRLIDRSLRDLKRVGVSEESIRLIEEARDVFEELHGLAFDLYTRE